MLILTVVPGLHTQQIQSWQAPQTQSYCCELEELPLTYSKSHSRFKATSHNPRWTDRFQEEDDKSEELNTAPKITKSLVSGPMKGFHIDWNGVDSV